MSETRRRTRAPSSGAVGCAWRRPCSLLERRPLPFVMPVIIPKTVHDLGSQGLLRGQAPFYWRETEPHTAPWGQPPQRSWSGLPCPPPGIFPTQGSNPGLQHCRQILYHLGQKGNPKPACKVELSAQNQFHTLAIWEFETPPCLRTSPARAGLPPARPSLHGAGVRSALGSDSKLGRHLQGLGAHGQLSGLRGTRWRVGFAPVECLWPGHRAGVTEFTVILG